MKLFVNNEEIDFELDNNELYLGQILDNLINYLHRQGFGYVEVYADDEAILYRQSHNALWQKKELTTIDQLHLKADFVLDLNEVIEALNLTLEAIKAENSDAMGKMGSMWPKICDSLRFWLMDFNLGLNFFQGLEQTQVLLMHFKENPALHTQSIKLLILALTALEEKDRELVDAKKELFVAIKKLSSMQTAISELGSDFQSGQDALAMEKVLEFMQFFQKTIRTSAFLKEDDYQLKGQLTAVIEQLSEDIGNFTAACENRDYILAGDIAEYEILEKVDLLKKIIE